MENYTIKKYTTSSVISSILVRVIKLKQIVRNLFAN